MNLPGSIVVCAFSLCAAAAAEAGIPSFADATDEAGVVFTHSPFPNHRASPMVAGGAIGDFNGDDYPDLFVIGGGSVADALFLNNGDGTFTDRAAEWGIDTPHRGVGATVGDYDGDGDHDLYVTSFGPVSEIDGPGQHLLYRNDGDRFTNVAGLSGVAFTTTSYPDGYGSAFGDYDRDGDLDLFVAGWHVNPALGSRLFRNRGDGTFDQVTGKAGVIQRGTHAFGAIWADMNGDRYPELLIAGDFGTARYYRNNRDGTFTDIDPGTGQVNGDEDTWSIGRAYNGMGQTVGDFNRDGKPDWFLTAIWPAFAFASDYWGNGLYMNQGRHIFLESSAAAGVNDGGWGWGSSAVDFNNDGWTDLVMTNGWPTPDSTTGNSFTDEQSYLWINNGNMTFDEVALGAGFEHTGQGRGLLHFDYDRDGDIDVVIMSAGEPLKLLRNQLVDDEQTPADASWLQVRLDTTCDATFAPDGAGAIVSLRAGGVKQRQQLVTGGTFVGQSELVLHFGLGSADSVDHLNVDWQRGVQTRLRNVEINQRMTITPCPPSGPRDRPRNRPKKRDRIR